MWNWAEKMTSTKGQRWNKTVNSWLLNDIQSRGKPKYRWHDIMNEFLGKVTGRLHWENALQKTAANKSEWLSIAKDFEKETSLMNDPDIDELWILIPTERSVPRRGLNACGCLPCLALDFHDLRDIKKNFKISMICMMLTWNFMISMIFMMLTWNSIIFKIFLILTIILNSYESRV